MKICSLYASTPSYDNGLGTIMKIVYSTLTELGVEFEEINILDLNIPYFCGMKTEPVRIITEKIKNSDAIIFATTSQLFQPSAVMKTLFDYFEMDIYKSLLDGKNCMIITIANTYGERETADYISRIISLLGGNEAVRITLGGSLRKVIGQSSHIQEIIEKNVEDFYRVFRQNKKYFRTSEVEIFNQNYIQSYSKNETQKKEMSEVLKDGKAAMNTGSGMLNNINSQQSQQSQQTYTQQQPQQIYTQQQPQQTYVQQQPQQTYAQQQPQQTYTQQQQTYMPQQQFTGQQSGVPVQQQQQRTQQTVDTNSIFSEINDILGTISANTNNSPELSREIPLSETKGGNLTRGNVPQQQVNFDRFTDRQQDDIKDLTQMFTEKFSPANNRQTNTMPAYATNFNNMVIPRTKTVKQMTFNLPHHFQPQLAADTNAIIQINITGGEKFDCYLSISGAECNCTEGVNLTPNLTVISNTTIWSEILKGKFTAQKAFMTGQLKVRGDFMLLNKFDQIFKKI